MRGSRKNRKFVTSGILAPSLFALGIVVVLSSCGPPVVRESACGPLYVGGDPFLYIVAAAMDKACALASSDGSSSETEPTVEPTETEPTVEPTRTEPAIEAKAVEPAYPFDGEWSGTVRPDGCRGPGPMKFTVANGEISGYFDSVQGSFSPAGRYKIIGRVDAKGRFGDVRLYGLGKLTGRLSETKGRGYLSAAVGTCSGVWEVSRL